MSDDTEELKELVALRIKSRIHTDEELADAEAIRDLMDQIEEVFEDWKGSQIIGALKILLAEQVVLQFAQSLNMMKTNHPVA